MKPSLSLFLVAAGLFCSILSAQQLSSDSASPDITMLRDVEATAASQPTDQTKDNAPPVFPGQTEGNFIIKDFHFKSGEVLPELRLHYVTLGTPHRNASDCELIRTQRQDEKKPCGGAQRSNR